MSRILDLLMFEARRLGRVGGLGLLLIVLAIGLDFMLLQPMQVERDRLAEHNLKQALLQPAGSQARPARKIETPVSGTADEALRRLFSAAARNGLILDQGDYTLSREKDGDVHRYQISLPVFGTYPALRAFVADALNADPALALSHLEMERGAIEETELVANLRFTLFLKEAK